MPCIVSTVESDSIIRFCCQEIYNFSFTFISPLTTYYYYSCHIKLIAFL